MSTKLPLTASSLGSYVTGKQFGAVLDRLRNVLTRNFAPSDSLPAVLKQPWLAYLATVLLQLAVSGLQSLIKLVLPSFGLAASLHLLVISAIAILWGTRPSVTATLVGALCFDYFDMVPHFSLTQRNLGNLASILVFLLIGFVMSYMVSRIQFERARAEERAQQVERLNEQMHTFLSLVSHELRTPLTTIQASTQIMSRKVARIHIEDSQIPLFLDGINLQTKRLGALLNDLIDIARIRTGKIEMHLEPCDLAELVTEEVRSLQLIYGTRTIDLTIAPQMLSPFVLADAHRLAQVLTNYLTNALKYSQKESPVEVHLRQEAHNLKVTVEDHGVGIPQEELEHIWNLFHRVEGIEVQSGSGIGLGMGLHICKTFIEDQHGTVGVTSTVNQGSQFWFTLPLLQETPQL